MIAHTSPSLRRAPPCLASVQSGSVCSPALRCLFAVCSSLSGWPVRCRAELRLLVWRVVVCGGDSASEHRPTSHYSGAHDERPTLRVCARLITARAHDERPLRCRAELRSFSSAPCVVLRRSMHAALLVEPGHGRVLLRDLERDRQLAVTTLTATTANS